MITKSFTGELTVKTKKKKMKQLFELKPRPTKDASPKEKLYNLVNKLSFGLRTP